MAQWIRPWTLSCEVPGSNLLAVAVVPLGKALYPHCLVPWKLPKAVGPLVSCLYCRNFCVCRLLSLWPGKIDPNYNYRKHQRTNSFPLKVKQ